MLLCRTRSSPQCSPPLVDHPEAKDRVLRIDRHLSLRENVRRAPKESKGQRRAGSGDVGTPASSLPTLGERKGHGMSST